MTAFLLLAAPMLLVGPQLFVNRSATPKMLAISAGLCLLLQSRLRQRAAAMTPALVFLGVCLVSWVFAADKWAAFVGAPKAPYYGLFPVALVVLAYLGSTEMDSDEAERALLAGAIALAGVAIIQQIAGRSFTGMALQGGRSSGFRGSPVMMAASLVPAFLVAWSRFRSRWFETCWAETLAMALILGAMLAARAKGAFLSVAVGVWVFETRGWVRWLGAFMTWAGVNNFIQRSPHEKERVELLKIAWKSFRQHPLVGWGPDCFLHALMKNRTAAYDAIVGAKTGQASAHQDLAQVAATLGLPGIGAYLWSLWGLLRGAYSDHLAVAVLVAMIVQAQVNPLPTDVLVATAVLVGSRTRDSEGCFIMPSWVAPAVMTAAVVLALNDLTPWARGLFH